MVAYTYEKERRKYRNRFSSQSKNGLMYFKHGITEFFIQSQPLNKKLKLYINNNEIKLIKNCRSLKLMNINSAIGGIFFWGTSKSNKNELQQWTKPKLGIIYIFLCFVCGFYTVFHGCYLIIFIIWIVFNYF